MRDAAKKVLFFSGPAAKRGKGKGVKAGPLRKKNPWMTTWKKEGFMSLLEWVSMKTNALNYPISFSFTSTEKVDIEYTLSFKLVSIYFAFSSSISSSNPS